MGKKIIITAGPTEEKLDDVMRISNMSSGRLGVEIAEAMAREPEIEKIYYVSTRTAFRPQHDKITPVTIQTADQLRQALCELLVKNGEHIHAVIHSCAVGDYTGRYGARAEDVAAEAAKRVLNIAYGDHDDHTARELVQKAILETLKHPKCVQDSSTKISSYEPNLMFMLDLTPKIIDTIKKLSPSTVLIGFKLLSGVPEEQLIQAAVKIRDRANADWIFANDKSLMGPNGQHPAIIIGRNGPEGRCRTKRDIAMAITARVLGRYEFDPEKPVDLGIIPDGYTAE